MQSAKLNNYAIIKMHRNICLIIETIAIFFINGLLANYIFNSVESLTYRWLIYAPLLLFQGFWLYRVYIIGHETAHKKLFPKSLRKNDFMGSLVLLPLLVPINIYRKIHYFHHGFNRKDKHTSNLDTFVVKGRFKSAKTVFFYTIWYLSVFCGGFFLHSLVSVFLFLFIPPQLAIKISPAFKGWKWKDQFKAIFLFSFGVAIHYGTYHFFGTRVYLLFLGYPMLSFAWVMSFLVYIFHYDTTTGEQVRYNVRSIRRVPVFSWILMNFNEHATHHQCPYIPWYDLPKKRRDLPQEFAEKNETTSSFIRLILNQLKGPNIVYED